MSLFNWLMLGLNIAIFAVVGSIGLTMLIKWLSKKHKDNKVKKEQAKIAKKAKEQAEKDARAAEVLKFMKELFGNEKK